jgi:hypothetical protein
VGGEGECAWYRCMFEAGGTLAEQYERPASTWAVRVRLGRRIGVECLWVCRGGRSMQPRLLID